MSLTSRPVAIWVMLAGTAVLAWLSLRDVPGVVNGADGVSTTTTFVHTTWWVAYLLLAVPLFLIACFFVVNRAAGNAGRHRRQPRVAYETTRRYTASGSADGLEILSNVLPVLPLFVYSTTLVVVLLTRHTPATA